MGVLSFLPLQKHFLIRFYVTYLIIIVTIRIAKCNNLILGPFSGGLRRISIRWWFRGKFNMKKKSNKFIANCLVGWGSKKLLNALLSSSIQLTSYKFHYEGCLKRKILHFMHPLPPQFMWHRSSWKICNEINDVPAKSNAPYKE